MVKVGFPFSPFRLNRDPPFATSSNVPPFQEGPPNSPRGSFLPTWMRPSARSEHFPAAGGPLPRWGVFSLLPLREDSSRRNREGAASAPLAMRV